MITSQYELEQGALTDIDPRQFRAVLGRFASGITIITARVDGTIHGMTANAFISVSLEPPLVLVSVDQKSAMHGFLQAAGRYGVSILAEHMANYSTHFSGRSVPELELQFFEAHGVPLLSGALAYLVVEVTDPHPAGDHTLFIGRVQKLGYDEERSPLLYYSGHYGKFVQD